MDMTYRVAQCDVCGQYPALGWLYQCNQDKYQEEIIKSENQRLNHNASDSSLGAELKTLGFSLSIINQAASGHYTEAQIDLLKAQKAHVRSVIAEQVTGSAKSGELNANDESVSIHPNITTRKLKLSNSKRRQLIYESASAVKCTLKCCHVCLFRSSIMLSWYPYFTLTETLQTCRSYYRDRAFGHLNSILDDINLAWTRRGLMTATDISVGLVRPVRLRSPLNPLEVLNPTEDSHDSSISSTSTSASDGADDGRDTLARDDIGSLAEHEEYICSRSTSTHGVSLL